MNKLSFYKILKKNKTLLLKFPLKLLKFKSSKWSIFKKNYSKKLKRSFFFNPLVVLVKVKSWEKRKRNFIKKLQLKRNLFQIFENSFNLSITRKYLSKIGQLDVEKVFRILFFQIQFRIDVLLYQLEFFENIDQSRKTIQNKCIYVNGYISDKLRILKKGDVISIKDTKLLNKTILLKFHKSSKFSSFVEIDYYTGTIVIIKDFTEATLTDCALLFPFYLDILKYYLTICKK